MAADDDLVKAAATVPASNTIADGAAPGIGKCAALALYLAADGLEAGSGHGAFDPRYYAERYPESAAAGLDPRAHYFRIGAREGRFANEPHEIAAATDLVRSGLLRMPGEASSEARRDQALALLREARQPRFAVNLNRDFVRIYYPYSRRGFFHELPFLNALFLASQPLRRSRSLLNSRRLIVQSGLFDRQAYHRRVILADPLIDSAVDPVLYYLTEGWRRLASPAQFSDRAYLVRYPDVIAANLCPLLHYLLHGQPEGRERQPSVPQSGSEAGRRSMRSVLASALGSRVGRGRPEAAASPAAARRSAGRRKVLFVTHEASRSGAPLLALNLCQSLAGSVDLVVASLGESGTLDDAFAAAAPYVTKPKAMAFGDFLDRVILAEHDVDVVVVNTLACGDAVADCAARDLKVLLLVHDFATYLRPFERICRSLLHCASVVFPSGLVEDDAFRTMAIEGLDLDRRFARVHHQGRIAPAEKPDPDAIARLDAFIAEHSAGSRPLVVMGAGYAQKRKGVPLFVDACAEVLRRRPDVNVVFVWVGEGYFPHGREEFSVFLSVQIERQPLQDRLLFLGETTALGEVFARADGFMLTSLLDPFPNVAIDALCNGTPLACFEKATGIADLGATFPDLVTVVPYRDVAGLGDWTLRLLDDPRPTPPTRRDEVRAYFDPAIYNAFIAGEVARLRGQEPSRDDALALSRELDLDAVRGLPEMRFACGPLLERTGEANLLRTFRQLRAKHRTLAIARSGTRIAIERRFPHRKAPFSLTLHYRSYALLDAPLAVALAGGETPTICLLDGTPLDEALRRALDPVRLAPDAAPGFRGRHLFAAVEGTGAESLGAGLRRLLNAYCQDADGAAQGCRAYCALDRDFDLGGENPEGAKRPSVMLLAIDAPRLAQAAARLAEPATAPSALRRLLRLAHALDADVTAPVPRDRFPVDVRLARPAVDLVPLPM